MKNIRTMMLASNRAESERAKNMMYIKSSLAYGDLVVMSIEAYEGLMETARVDAAISEAETEHAAGVLLDAREALSSLRGKHFGKQPL